MIAIYSHPDYYPPTLSAVENLAPLYDDIYILHRNIPGLDWEYPSNVHLVSPKKIYSRPEVESAGFFRKLSWYASFSRKLLQLFIKYKPDTFLIYDYHVILAYRYIFKLIRKPRIIWYHNHDVGDKQYLRRYSISSLSWKSEEWLFPKLQIFTLPALERRPFFPMKRFRGQFFFLPNFPSSFIYTPEKTATKRDPDMYRVLFQGSIGPKHGFEELIPLLEDSVNGKQLTLVLKGFVSEEYLKQLEELARTSHVADKLEYIGPTNYRQVIENGRKCHIGLAIHLKDDIMNKTLGTASNKIYEYAALGLPVILFDNAHFREILGKYEWAFFTDTSRESLKQCLSSIIDQYGELSNKAIIDFKEHLSFELFFEPVKNYLKSREFE